MALSTRERVLLDLERDWAARPDEEGGDPGPARVLAGLLLCRTAPLDRLGRGVRIRPARRAAAQEATRPSTPGTPRRRGLHPTPEVSDGATSDVSGAVSWLSADPDHTALFTDFDGTLSPIVARPELARPLTGATESLKRLASRLAVVGVVSGRPVGFLVDRLGLEDRHAGPGAPRHRTTSRPSRGRPPDAARSGLHALSASTVSSIGVPPEWSRSSRRCWRGGTR